MVIIALSGCDGSGKTTLALTLYETLKACGIKTEYRKEFKYFLLKYILKALDKNKIFRERKKFLRKEKSISKIDHLKYKFWPFFVWLDSNLEILYLKLIKRSNIIILDRCIIDHLAGFEYLKYISKNTRNLLIKYSIKPNPIIILDNLPEIMYKRKKKTHQYPLEFYERQRRRYLDIARKLGAPIIRTDISVEKSLRGIIKHILLQLTKPEDIILHILSDPFNDPSIENFSESISKKNIFERDKLGYIIMEASKNNVEFPVYERLSQCVNKDIIKRALRIAKSKYNTFRSVLSIIIDTFDNIGINYVIFKTLPPYKYLPRDIDILINEDDKKRVINALTSRGFKISKTHIIHKAISLTMNNFDLDLHWRVEWMGHKVIDESIILDNHYSYKLDDIIVQIPDPSQEFLLVAAHSILQHHYMTLGELHYLRALIKKYKLDWDFIFEVAQRKCLWKKLTKCLASILIKDVLFYNSNIVKKLPENILSMISKTGISVSKHILEPVIWYDPIFLPISNIPSLIDSLLNLYRYLRYKVTKHLPYNEPLSEIKFKFLDS